MTTTATRHATGEAFNAVHARGDLGRFVKMTNTPGTKQLTVPASAVRCDTDDAPATLEEAAARYSELAAVHARRAKQPPSFHAAFQHASLQLLAAGIRDKHPGAESLKLRNDHDAADRFEPAALYDGRDEMLEHGKYGNRNIFGAAIPGTGVSVNDLLGNLGRNDRAWMEGGIGEVAAGPRQWPAAIDLEAVLAAPAPAYESVEDPAPRYLPASDTEDFADFAYAVQPQPAAPAGGTRSRRGGMAGRLRSLFRRR